MYWNEKRKYMLTACDGGKQWTLFFEDYQQAYDYALSMAYLMFSHEFCQQFIKYYFDKNGGFRLGPDVISLS